VKSRIGLRAEAGEVGRDLAAAAVGVRLEHHAVPGLHRVVAQVQARVVGEMRRADQLALQIVGPAVQRADDRAAGVATAAQHHRLAVPADVRDQLDALRRADQGTALTLLDQRVVVADLRHRELVADIARPAAKQGVDLALKQLRIEIAANGQLGAAALQLRRGHAQVGHGPSFSNKKPRVELVSPGRSKSLLDGAADCSRGGFGWSGTGGPFAVSAIGDAGRRRRTFRI
jgi:hypothetical protein